MKNNLLSDWIMPSFSQRIVIFLGLFALLACRGREQSSDTPEAVEATEQAVKAAREDSALRNAKVSWQGEKTYDLTGDGREERLSVKAYGPTYDSLLILLEIFGPDSVVLYRDQWSSALYFVYDARPGKADTTVTRIVVGHLKRILSDSAFTASPVGHHAMIDTVTVRYDLAEQSVREKEGLLDTTTLMQKQYDAIEQITIPRNEVIQVINEVKLKPRFMYFAGGEVTYVLAWSDRLKRFIRVFSCC